MASTAALKQQPAANQRTATADVIPINKRIEEVEKNPDSVRMFRLWNAKEKHQVQYRYYSDRKRAHMGALYEVRWSEVGTTIEVFDIRNGKLLGQYTRRLHDIHFLGE